MKRNDQLLFVLDILCLLCILTAGCKRTPDKSVVINKDDNKIYEKANAGDTIDTPDKLKEEWISDNGKFKITIDADVNIPNVTAFPVVNIEPMDISQDKATQIIRCLIGEKQIYEINETKTKSDIEQEILQIQNYSINDLPNEETDPIMYKNIYNSRTETLKELYQQLETAPDKFEKK